MKKILIILLISTQIFALSINESLLKIHATLVPKIYFMDYKFKEKLKNNTLSIAILYQKGEYKEANLLKKKIETRYKNGIKSFKIITELVLFSKVERSHANIYYLFPSSVKNIKKVVALAKENRAITFSYLQSDLSHGVMISVDISKKIKPIINLHAIKRNHIALRPILIDISTIYRKAVSSKTINQILNLNTFKRSYIAQKTSLEIYI